MDKIDTVFLTGATGVLGKALFDKIYRTTTANFIILARSHENKTHLDRAGDLFSELGAHGEPGNRVKVLDGDVSMENFWLSGRELETLRQEVSMFFHAAALTNHEADEEELEYVNVVGTKNSIDIAKDLFNNGQLKNYFYMSAAYVSGSLESYHSLEDVLPAKSKNRNFYELSKFKAELNVREAIKDGLPATIFRPSVVVGDSVTGAISEFKVFYQFIRPFLQGILTKVIGRVENTINIVPIDFVINAICEIIKQDNIIGKTYHLVSPNPPTIEMLLEVPSFEPDYMVPDFEIINPDDFNDNTLNGDEKAIYDTIDPYMGYLESELTFDMTNIIEALKDTPVSLPVTDRAFLITLYKYAIKARYFRLRKKDLTAV